MVCGLASEWQLERSHLRLKVARLITLLRVLDGSFAEAAKGTFSHYENLPMETLPFETTVVARTPVEKPSRGLWRWQLIRRLNVLERPDARCGVVERLRAAMARLDTHLPHC